MFHFGVFHVVRLSANEQMIRVNALANIAFVANAHALWNFVIENNPRQSMSEQAVNFAVSIVFVCDMAHPNPTAAFRNGH